MRMFFPEKETSADCRSRLSRGSVERQTVQSQPMTGTPCEVPVPSNFRVTGLRIALARLARRGAPRLRVISHAEIPEACTIRVAAVVGARASLPA